MLSDGMPHYREQLRECVPDELASLYALKMHISRIRKVLRPRGQDIVCEIVRRQIHYRHVQLLTPPEQS